MIQRKKLQILTVTRIVLEMKIVTKNGSLHLTKLSMFHQGRHELGFYTFYRHVQKFLDTKKLKTFYQTFFQTFFRQFLDIYRYFLDIKLFLFFRHFLDIFQTFFRHFLNIFQAFFRHFQTLFFFNFLGIFYTLKSRF